MPEDAHTLAPAQAFALGTLVTPTDRGIASRVLARTSGGNVTLFAFDAGQGLEEHTSPFDALVMVLEGALSLTIGGTGVQATPGTVVRMPGGRTSRARGQGADADAPGHAARAQGGLKGGSAWTDSPEGGFVDGRRAAAR